MLSIALRGHERNLFSVEVLSRGFEIRGRSLEPLADVDFSQLFDIEI